MIIQTLNILGHDIVCEADITLDQEMLNEVHDAIYEQIISGEWMLTEHKGGVAEMFCEGDESHPYTPVDVKWHIVDWKQIAQKLYNSINQHCYKDTGTLDLIKAVEEYEELAKLTNNDN